MRSRVVILQAYLIANLERFFADGYKLKVNIGGEMAFETEGDWKCPKCEGVEFYKTREEIQVGVQRVTQYKDVRKCAKCDVNMQSESNAKIENSTSGCITTGFVIAFGLGAVYWLIQLFS